jgi:hypothetical protein
MSMAGIIGIAKPAPETTNRFKDDSAAAMGKTWPSVSVGKSRMIACIGTKTIAAGMYEMFHKRQIGIVLLGTRSIRTNGIDSSRATSTLDVHPARTINRYQGLLACEEYNFTL